MPLHRNELYSLSNICGKGNGKDWRICEPAKDCIGAFVNKAGSCDCVCALGIYDNAQRTACQMQS